MEDKSLSLSVRFQLGIWITVAGIQDSLLGGPKVENRLWKVDLGRSGPIWARFRDLAAGGRFLAGGARKVISGAESGSGSSQDRIWAGGAGSGGAGAGFWPGGVPAGVPGGVPGGPDSS